MTQPTTYTIRPFRADPITTDVRGYTTRREDRLDLVSLEFDYAGRTYTLQATYFLGSLTTGVVTDDHGTPVVTLDADPQGVRGYGGGHYRTCKWAHAWDGSDALGAALLVLDTFSA